VNEIFRGLPAGLQEVVGAPGYGKKKPVRRLRVRNQLERVDHDELAEASDTRGERIVEGSIDQDVAARRHDAGEEGDERDPARET